MIKKSEMTYIEARVGQLRGEALKAIELLFEEPTIGSMKKVSRKVIQSEEI